MVNDVSGIKKKEKEKVKKQFRNGKGYKCHVEDSGEKL